MFWTPWHYHKAVSSHHIAHIYSMKALGLLTFSLIWRFGLSILHFWKVLDLKRTGQEGKSIKNFEYLFQRLTSTLKRVCTLPYVRLVASSTKFGRYAGIHEVQAICYAPKDYPSLWYIGHVNITSLSLSAYSRLANYGTSLFLYAASSSVAWHLWQCWSNFARISYKRERTIVVNKVGEVLNETKQVGRIVDHFYTMRQFQSWVYTDTVLLTQSFCTDYLKLSVMWWMSILLLLYCCYFSNVKFYICGKTVEGHPYSPLSFWLSLPSWLR